jgi:hypothetical protein
MRTEELLLGVGSPVSRETYFGQLTTTEVLSLVSVARPGQSLPPSSQWLGRGLLVHSSCLITSNGSGTQLRNRPRIGLLQRSTVRQSFSGLAIWRLPGFSSSPYPGQTTWLVASPNLETAGYVRTTSIPFT